MVKSPSHCPPFIRERRICRCLLTWVRYIVNVVISSLHQLIFSSPQEEITPTSGIISNSPHVRGPDTRSKEEQRVGVLIPPNHKIIEFPSGVEEPRPRVKSPGIDYQELRYRFNQVTKWVKLARVNQVTKWVKLPRVNCGRRKGKDINNKNL